MLVRAQDIQINDVLQDGWVVYFVNTGTINIGILTFTDRGGKPQEKEQTREIILVGLRRSVGFPEYEASAVHSKKSWYYKDAYVEVER